MRASEVAEMARLMRESYRPEQLDPGLARPAVVDLERGFRAVAVPRADAPEPYRSFRLIDAAALDTVLVVTFTWDDGADDGTVFVLPVDGRDVELDIRDGVAVTTFLNHLLEFTLGGPRDAWEPARTTPIGPRLSVVRPWSTGD
ncbi:MAG: hypothetical protein ABW212_19030 [Pseudonocardia sediminis]